MLNLNKGFKRPAQRVACLSRCRQLLNGYLYGLCESARPLASLALLPGRALSSGQACLYARTDRNQAAAFPS